VLSYLVLLFTGMVSDKKATVQKNEIKIAELKQKLKEVEDYEKRNAMFQQRKDIIETLGKNKTIPVKILNEISVLLPVGVWLTAADVKGYNVNLNCTAYSNDDVVNYVNNLKSSKLFTDIYLQESIQAQVTGYALYNFKLTLKVKV
jgi:type IV pilus assembly protein PilN